MRPPLSLSLRWRPLPFLLRNFQEFSKNQPIKDKHHPDIIYYVPPRAAFASAAAFAFALAASLAALRVIVGLRCDPDDAGSDLPLSPTYAERTLPVLAARAAAAAWAALAAAASARADADIGTEEEVDVTEMRPVVTGAADNDDDDDDCGGGGFVEGLVKEEGRLVRDCFREGIVSREESRGAEEDDPVTNAAADDDASPRPRCAKDEDDDDDAEAAATAAA